MDTFLAAAAALAAPIGVGFLFTLAIRALMNADRNERVAMARLELEERARRQVPEPGSVPATPSPVPGPPVADDGASHQH